MECFTKCCPLPEGCLAKMFGPCTISRRTPEGFLGLIFDDLHTGLYGKDATVAGSLRLHTIYKGTLTVN